MLAVPVLALSASATALAIAYAWRRHLLDHPGQRRSHRVPTPRGGGIGIVLAVLFALAAVAWQSTPPARELAVALGIGVLCVGLVGWIDDHGGLRARTRFAVHVLAAVVLLATPVPLLGLSGSAALLYALVAVVPCIGIVWSINLHNFMDGIDGLLATQAIFVFAALAWLFLPMHPAQAAASGLFALAVLGFLPFNFPRARIFMGDVGSGVLGLLVAAMVAWQMATPGIAAATGLVLCSSFITDATCTLLSRMWRGRRWYSAHREHLYQWLVRSGRSHAQVVGLYMAWNLLLAFPVALWMNRINAVSSPAASLAGLGIVFGTALPTWMAGKSWCLRRAHARGRHATA